jgi:L-seryl-tRNA(Ser) seleniumtransferase
MTATPADEKVSAFKYLPSVDELSRSEMAGPLIDDLGRRRLTALSRKVIDELRGELSQREPATFTKESVLNEAERRLMAEWEHERRLRLRRVINATGVVIHTNLGRAPLSEPARRALMEAAGYCNVEYDIAKGKRGRRGSHLEAMLTELTGAEDALVVNNCAAAAFFVLSVFAAGREVVISRGELVEIGGDFRVPRCPEAVRGDPERGRHDKPYQAYRLRGCHW